MAKHIKIAIGDQEKDESINHILLGGWGLTYLHEPAWSGLKMGVYSRVVNGVTEYALVNRGTDGNLTIVDDVIQAFGMSQALSESMDFARSFVNNHEGFEVTMVGHSKGCLEATWNAIVTGTNCITFNPMVITVLSRDVVCYMSSLVTYQGLLAKGEVTMTHHVVEGEYLNRIFGNSIIGETKFLKSPYKPTLQGRLLGLGFGFSGLFTFGGVYFENHNIDTVQTALLLANPRLVR